ncbi:MAG: hypothetical protein ACI9DK_002467 [Vicingaceae bacterium]|jgi:hypothetical protein
MIRLKKLAFELNISTSSLISEISKDFERNLNLNSVLNTEEIKAMRVRFIADKKLKIESNKKKNTFGFDLNENFNFSIEEKKDHPTLSIEYDRAEKDKVFLENRENKYWALDVEEIDTLLKLKISKLYNIQNEIYSIRDTKRLNNDKVKGKKRHQQIRNKGYSSQSKNDRIIDDETSIMNMLMNGDSDTIGF